MELLDTLSREKQTALEVFRGQEVQQRAERRGLLEQWEKDGTITVQHWHPSGGDDRIRVICGDVVLFEEAMGFPSEVLVTKVALAVRSGHNNRDGRPHVAVA